MFPELSILFLIQSLVFSTVACNATPARPAQKWSRVTCGMITLHQETLSSKREFGPPVGQGPSIITFCTIVWHGFSSIVTLLHSKNLMKNYRN